jgi:hypothetical protein
MPRAKLLTSSKTQTRATRLITGSVPVTPIGVNNVGSASPDAALVSEYVSVG